MADQNAKSDLIWMKLGTSGVYDYEFGNSKRSKWRTKIQKRFVLHETWYLWAFEVADYDLKIKI